MPINLPRLFSEQRAPISVNQSESVFLIHVSLRLQRDVCFNPNPGLSQRLHANDVYSFNARVNFNEGSA